MTKTGCKHKACYLVLRPLRKTRLYATVLESVIVVPTRSLGYHWLYFQLFQMVLIWYRIVLILYKKNHQKWLVPYIAQKQTFFNIMQFVMLY